MAKRTRIEPTLFQCPICKKKFFSYHERMWCPECTENGTVVIHKTSAVGKSELRGMRRP